MTTGTSVSTRVRQRNPVVFLVPVVLALIGVGITDYSPADAHLYWVFMVQVVHWSACFVAVLILLLLLSLSVFLDGIHLGVYAYLFGTLLASMTVAMAYVEEFIWIILMISVAVTAIAAIYRAKSRSG